MYLLTEATSTNLFDATAAKRAELTAMRFQFTSPTEFRDLVYALMGREPDLSVEEAIDAAERAAAATDICCAPDAEGDAVDRYRNERFGK